MEYKDISVVHLEGTDLTYANKLFSMERFLKATPAIVESPSDRRHVAYSQPLAVVLTIRKKCQPTPVSRDIYLFYKKTCFFKDEDKKMFGTKNKDKIIKGVIEQRIDILSYKNIHIIITNACF